MTYLKFLFLLLSGFSLMKDCNTGQSNKPPEELYNHWIHSHEDDKEDYRAFRPDTYNFPPSRGREGFEIKEDGTFIWHRIAPADGTEKIQGTWSWNEADDRMVVKFGKEAPRQEMELKVLEVDEQMLKLK